LAASSLPQLLGAGSGAPNQVNPMLVELVLVDCAALIPPVVLLGVELGLVDCTALRLLVVLLGAR
jgi:hypothetical protein